MILLDTIRKPVYRELDEFDKFISDKFTADGELLSDMLRYALSARGKGIRPTIVLLSAALNGSTESNSIGRRTYLAAMLVEMIHVASLVHDDVIDESDMRRGKASINARWQSHKAVLLGDYILAKNMSIGLSSAQYDIVNHVCGSIAILCEGEVLQSECVDKRIVSRQAYLDVIYKKTASLIGISSSVGALSVGASREKISTMRRFGEAIGMAFQIQDDILDYAHTAHTGKPANNDLREKKITLPLLAVLDTATDERREELLSYLDKCHEDEDSIQYIQKAVEDGGGLTFAVEVMQSYLTDAVGILSEYEPSEYRTALINLCAYISERDK